MKIDQLAFIKDFVIKKGLTDCNTNIIPMKAESAIEITDLEDYKETKLREYQRLISKLIYLACGTKSDILFIVGQFSKRNINPRKGYLQAAKRVVRYLKGII